MEEFLSAALAHHRQGAFDQAARIYEGILARDPGHADALHLLGLTALQQGDPERAAVLIGRAAALAPSVAAYQANLAESYRLLGRFEAAAAASRRALELEPRSPGAANTLGLCLEALGQPEAAAEQYAAALQLDPGFAPAHSNLGVVLHGLGKRALAIEHFRQALHFDPGMAETHSNLGQLLLDEGRPEEALSHCREAVRLRPGFSSALMNLGRVLHTLGRTAEARAYSLEALRIDPTLAVACDDLGQLAHEEGKLTESLAWFQRSLQLAPGFAPAHCHLGEVLHEMGDAEAAQGSFHAALHHDPGHAEAYHHLATMLGRRLPESDQAAMRRLATAPSLSEDERSTLLSGLAQVLDAQGDYAGAAELLGQANALCLSNWSNRGQGYDPTENDQFIDDMIGACSPAFFDRVRGYGCESERPVFIVGLPRSGTTLTEQILASHSQVFGAGELALVGELFGSLPRLMHSSAPAAQCLERLDRATAQRLAAHYLEKLGALEGTGQALRIVDKMPENYVYLGLLAALFPKARFVHCRRDRRDVALSCWMTHFRRIRWASDFGHIAKRVHAYQRIMDHWRQVLPVEWVDVWYEETVADLEWVARGIVAWCGLDWEPACLAFHEGRRPVRSASLAQVRRPLYAHSVGRWKNYEHLLAPLFEQL
jgi:tetratricopeptide (TPR) repeat protein